MERMIDAIAYELAERALKRGLPAHNTIEATESLAEALAIALAEWLEKSGHRLG